MFVVEDRSFIAVLGAMAIATAITIGSALFTKETPRDPASQPVRGLTANAQAPRYFALTLWRA